MPPPHRPMLGILGGTGMGDALGVLGKGEQHWVDTPFGPPAAPITVAEVAGVPVALLARHGEGHRYPPSEVPYRANVFALKSLGVTHLLATSAAGSLREEIHPRDLVLPDQLIDRTHRRESTFFDALAVHVEFAQPFCSQLRRAVLGAAEGKARDGGTYVCMEGPQFSTRAESELYRSWGADVIGMTNLTEARLCREAEICYASLALVTDYDCWHPHSEDVSVEVIVAILGENAAAARRALSDAVGRVHPDRRCSCRNAMRYAIITDRSAIPESARERLRPIAGRYL